MRGTLDIEPECLCHGPRLMERGHDPDCPYFVPGFVVCDAMAAQCRCVKPIDHIEAGDDVHQCDPNKCTGQWRGDLETGTFEAVQWPMKVGGTDE